MESSKEEFYKKEFLIRKHNEWLPLYGANLDGDESKNDGPVVMAAIAMGNVKINKKTSTAAGKTLGSTTYPVAACAGTLELATLVPENLVQIADLIIDRVLVGKFLMCRVIAPAYKGASLDTVVEDPRGEQPIRLSLYNYMACAGRNALFEESVAVLPVGTILAIKNPWFKTTLDGGLSLRSDNPRDVLVLDEDAVKKVDENIKWAGSIPEMYKKYMKADPPAEVTDCDCDGKLLGVRSRCEYFRNGGNEYFLAKKYFDAIGAYSQALKLDPGQPLMVDLLANRAAAYLNIDRFGLALSDVNHVLQLNPVHLKAFYRKTKALCGLRKYDEALEFLQTDVLPAFPKNKQIRELWDKTNMMVAQSKLGQYRLADIIKGSSPGQILDWAEYEGPVEVKQTADGRGRGMFATEKILAGQLILASKAFVYPLLERPSVPTAGGLFGQFGLALGPMSTTQALRSQRAEPVARRIRDNPENGKAVYALYAGPELGFLNPEKDDCSIIDMKRIDAIIDFNAFGSTKATEDHRGQISQEHGLWILPSYLNHSCINSNSHYQTYGDFLFIRAFKDIQIGEEILTSYTNVTKPLKERRQRSFKNLGFDCKCDLCEYERQEPESVQHEIAEILKQFIGGQLIKKSQDYTQRMFAGYIIESWPSKIDRLAQLRSAHNYFLAPFLDILADEYFDVDDYENAAKYYEKSFHITKNTYMCFSAFLASCNLVKTYASWLTSVASSESKVVIKKTKKMKFWFEEAKKLAVICWGKDADIEVVAADMVDDLKSLRVYNIVCI